MCRAPIGEGDWSQKIFEVISKATLKKEGQNNDDRKKIVEFINRKTRFIRIA